MDCEKNLVRFLTSSLITNKKHFSAEYYNNMLITFVYATSIYGRNPRVLKKRYTSFIHCMTVTWHYVVKKVWHQPIQQRLHFLHILTENSRNTFISNILSAILPFFTQFVQRSPFLKGTMLYLSINYLVSRSLNARRTMC